MKPPEVIKTAAISARQSEAVTKSSIGATASATTFVTKTLKCKCAYVWGPTLMRLALVMRALTATTTLVG